MRSVISAIWTSALPVSVALSPNFSTSSCLRSWVSVMRPMRLARSAGNSHPAEPAPLLELRAEIGLDRRRVLELVGRVADRQESERSERHVLAEVAAALPE